MDQNFHRLTTSGTIKEWRLAGARRDLPSAVTTTYATYLNTFEGNYTETPSNWLLQLFFSC